MENHAPSYMTYATAMPGNAWPMHSIDQCRIFFLGLLSTVIVGLLAGVATATNYQIEALALSTAPMEAGRSPHVDLYAGRLLRPAYVQHHL
jgi:hypothetical protein